MSKSYKKFASSGICCGSNTIFYRDRNRHTRRKNRHLLRIAINGCDDLDKINAINFIKNKRNPNFNPWNEPTDGHWHTKTFREYLNNRAINFLYNTSDGDLKRHLNNYKKYKRK